MTDQADRQAQDAINQARMPEFGDWLSRQPGYDRDYLINQLLHDSQAMDEFRNKNKGDVGQTVDPRAMFESMSDGALATYAVSTFDQTTSHGALQDAKNRYQAEAERRADQLGARVQQLQTTDKATADAITKKAQDAFNQQGLDKKALANRVTTRASGGVVPASAEAAAGGYTAPAANATPEQTGATTGPGTTGTTAGGTPLINMSDLSTQLQQGANFSNLQGALTNPNDHTQVTPLDQVPVSLYGQGTDQWYKEGAQVPNWDQSTLSSYQANATLPASSINAGAPMPNTGDTGQRVGGGVTMQSQVAQAGGADNMSQWLIGQAGGHMNWSESLSLLYNLPKQELINLQTHLVASGLYTQGGDPLKAIMGNTIRWGDASDPDTQAAWQALVFSAAMDPTHPTISQVMASKEQGFLPLIKQSIDKSNADVMNSLVGELHLTNPANIADSTRSAFRDALGRNPTDAEVNEVVSRVHGQEAGAHNQARASVQSALPRSPDIATMGAPTGPAISGSDEDRFMAFVKQHESGGNYKAFNPTGGPQHATGAYQIMTGTWHDYGGYHNAMDAPPAVQDAYMRTVLLPQYKALGSDPGIWAVGHYLGTGGAQDWIRGGMDPNFAPPENHGFKAMTYYNQARNAMGLGAGVANPLTNPAAGLGVGPGAPSFDSQTLKAASLRANTTITDAGNPAAVAAEMARKNHPVEYQAQSIGNDYYDLLQMLQGKLPAGAGTPQP